MGIEKVLQILQSFTHPHVILNLFDFLSLMEHHHNIIFVIIINYYSNKYFYLALFSFQF